MVAIVGPPDNLEENRCDWTAGPVTAAGVFLNFRAIVGGESVAFPDDARASSCLASCANPVGVFPTSVRRPFEDWILEPKCRHRLSQLRERVDSQDVPSLTAK